MIEKQLWMLYRKQRKWTWNRSLHKERKKRVWRILPDWWQKRPRNCWMWNQQFSNYNIVSDWWNLANWIFQGKWEIGENLQLEFSIESGRKQEFVIGLKDSYECERGIVMIIYTLSNHARSWLNSTTFILPLFVKCFYI